MKKILFFCITFFSIPFVANENAQKKDAYLNMLKKAGTAVGLHCAFLGVHESGHYAMAQFLAKGTDLIVHNKIRIYPHDGTSLVFPLKADYPLFQTQPYKNILITLAGPLAGISISYLTVKAQIF